jgi:hypothetical protein
VDLRAVSNLVIRYVVDPVDGFYTFTFLNENETVVLDALVVNKNQIPVFFGALRILNEDIIDVFDPGSPSARVLHNLNLKKASVGFGV